MPRRSPLTSVTPALSIATSVPVPIAMPTWRCASAGASLMPSPAIATTRPSLCSRSMPSAFSSGSTSATTSSIPSACADRLRRSRGCRRSASRCARPRACSGANRLGRRRLDRIGDAEQAGDLRRRPRRTRPSGPRARSASARAPRSPRVDAQLLEQRSVAERDAPALDVPAHALAGHRLEALGRRGAPRRARARRATIAAASGCSLARSRLGGERAAARPRRRRRAGDDRRRARGLPSVSVPVLSTTSVSTVRSTSSASAFWNSTPSRRAPARRRP